MARVADPNRRNDILRAARAVFNERGYASARMAEIAERAGVATGTLYLYFRSKEALIDALGEDYMIRLQEKLLPYLDNPDIPHSIANAVHISLAFAEAEQDILVLLNLRTALGQRRQVLPADLQFQQMLAQRMEERMNQGKLLRYDPQILAEVITGLMEWVSKACFVWGSGDIIRYEETVIRILQYALLPSDSARDS